MFHLVQKRLQEDPKLLPQEEATYAEPILMPTVNKTMTLTPSNIVQHQQQQQMNGNHCGGGGYSTTSPKATLRKVINNHNSALTSNNANNTVGALFESSPSPCPSNGLYAPYSDHGNNYATATNTTMSNNPARDPYSSFRSRDAYGAGSMRSQQQPQHSTAYNGQQQLVRNGRRCGRPPAAWAARRLGRPLRWNAPIQQQSRKSWRQLQNGP
jgi:hypothetical protein